MRQHHHMLQTSPSQKMLPQNTANISCLTDTDQIIVGDNHSLLNSNSSPLIMYHQMQQQPQQAHQQHQLTHHQHQQDHVSFCQVPQSNNSFLLHNVTSNVTKGRHPSQNYVYQQPQTHQPSVISSYDCFHNTLSTGNVPNTMNVTQTTTSLSSLSTSTRIRSPKKKQNLTHPQAISTNVHDSTDHKLFNMPATETSNSKRKRAKLVELLTSSCWQKISLLEKNLSKLSKILATCNANFIDEKNGQCPLSLAVTSTHLQPLNNSQILTNAMLQLRITKSQTYAHSLDLQKGVNSDAPIVKQVITILVRYGAQFDLRNKDGRTAVHMAAIKSNFWALKTLLELGASACYTDNEGLTPLYHSILNKADLPVTQLLLYETPPQSSILDIVDQQGWQAVHHASKLGLDAHLERLLYFGCDKNAKITGSGNTPLHLAAINDKLDCAKIMLLRGANKSLTNNSHQTAHQVAVISNNMDIAELIAEHNSTKVVLFNSRLSVGNNIKTSSNQNEQAFTTASTQISSSTSVNNLQNQVSDMKLEPGNSLSNQIRGKVLSISPCLSQRSFATSNTTSTSGVFCEEFFNNSNEDQLNNNKTSHSTSTIYNDLTTNSLSQHSGLTVVSNKNGSKNLETVTQTLKKDFAKSETSRDVQTSYNDEEDSSDSSGLGELISLMSENRPLFIDSIVEATSGYQAGDPSHLQLARGDLIQVLSYPPEIFRNQPNGILMIANKPLLFGKRLSDNVCGLFPSFCVKRSKIKSPTSTQTIRRHTLVPKNQGSLGNESFCSLPDPTNAHSLRVNDNYNSLVYPSTHNTNSRHSMSAFGNFKGSQSTFSFNSLPPAEQYQRRFVERNVLLAKMNEGFGFVLRGAKTARPTDELGSYDNYLDLISLQYFDEVEPSSVAHKAGLLRGDFLLAVNGVDVKNKSHEEVVQLIRNSGNQCSLVVATLIQNHMSDQTQTLGRINNQFKHKPEPPKRNPYTTLTRDRAH